MITKIRHTGIYVQKKQLVKTKQFYNKLGFDVFYEGTEKYPYFGTIDIIKLKTKNGDVLELVGEDTCRTYSGSHLALQVDNIDNIFNQLKNEVSFMFPPMVSNDKTAKISFCLDVNGFILELVEVL